MCTPAGPAPTIAMLSDSFRGPRIQPMHRLKMGQSRDVLRQSLLGQDVSYIQYHQKRVSIDQLWPTER